jgi:hypothetical protein
MSAETGSVESDAGSTEGEIDQAARIEGPPFEGMPTRGAAALRNVSAAVVVGEQAVTTALVAIGAARGVARTRVVTIVDLIGDVPALRALAADDDPHGVADCFVYGISPKAVTRRTHADDRLFVIPGGTEPLDPLTMVPSDRWGRLVAEYREAGALLLFVAAVRTPGLAELVAQTDGVIAVGEIDSLLPPGVRVLATAQRPRRARVRLERPSGEIRRRRAWRLPAVIGLAAAILIAVTTWLTLHRTAIEPIASATPAAAAPDTVSATSSAQLGPATAPTTPMASGDSTTAVAYTHRVATLASYSVALRQLRRQHDSLTAATISPVADSAGRLHYELLAGAYKDSAAAGTSVVRAPLALVLEGDLSPDSAQKAVVHYLDRGIPAYTLSHPDGRATVYAGAFDNAQAAGPLTASLRAAGLAPVLSYRR